MNNRKPFLKSVKHTFGAGDRSRFFLLAGNFISVLALEGVLEIDFHDGRQIELLQGFKINFSAEQEFDKFTVRRRDGDAADAPVSVWLAYGWEPRQDANKSLFEDNRAIFDIQQLTLNLAAAFESNLPTWTRPLPCINIEEQKEDPAAGYEHILPPIGGGAGYIVRQVTLSNPRAIERRIRVGRGIHLADGNGGGKNESLSFEFFVKLENGSIEKLGSWSSAYQQVANIGSQVFVQYDKRRAIVIPGGS